MNTTPYGLSNIILNDSFIRGQRCELHCDGHTNLHGKNAAGKTSTLTLQPIFYGRRPDTLIQRSGGKRSFVDYYLPRLQSMIIFEYHRENGICCVVLYRHPTYNKHVYRFVAGDAESTIFSEANERAFAEKESAHSILSSLRSQKIHISTIIDSAARYEAILSNQIRKLDANEKQIARDFALPPHGSSMQHIAALTSVMQSKNSMLAELKNMFSDIIAKAHHLGEKPQIQQDQSANQLKNLRNLQAQEPILHHGVAQAKNLQESHHELAAYAILAEERREHSQQCKNDLIERLETAARQFTAAEAQTNAQIANLNRDKAETDGICEGKQNRLKSIRTEAKKFQEKQIDHKIRQYQSLDDKRAELRRVADRYQQLTAQQQDITGSHQAAINRIEQDSQKAIERINQERQQNSEDYQQQQHDIIEQQENLTDKHQHAHEQLNQSHRHAQEPLQKALEALKIAYDKWLPEEEQAYQHIEAQIQRARDQQARQQAALQQAQNTLAQAKQHREQQETYYHHAKTNHSQAEQTLDTLQTILSGNNTLLAYLRKNERDWENIAKLINPELLRATHLEPQWQDNANTFYGLALNLEKLKLPLEAQPDENIRARIERQISIINDTEKQLKKAEAILKKAQAAEQAAETTLHLTKQQYQTSEQQLQNLDGDKTQLLATQKTARATRNSENQQQQNELTQQLETLKNQQKQESETLKQQQHNERQQLRTAQAQAKNHHDVQLAALQQREQEIQTKKQQEIAAQNTIYHTQLQEQGIDPRTIEQAKQQHDTLEHDIKTIEAYRAIIKDYKYFQENEYKKIPQLEDDIAELTQHSQQLTTQIRTLETEWQNRKAAYEKEKAQRNAEREKHQRRENELISRIQQSHAILQELEPRDKVPTDSDNLFLPDDHDRFIQRIDTLFEQCETQENALRSAYTAANNILQNAAGSQLGQAWQDRLSSLSIPPHKRSYFPAVMKILDQMLREDIPQAYAAALHAFNIHRGNINTYHTSLNEFSKNVQNYANRLTKELNTEHQFNAISDIQISLSAKIGEDDILNTLQHFLNAYKSAPPQGNELPSEALIDSYQQALDTLATSQIDHNNPASLIHMAIKAKENGREVIIRRDADLENASSTGVSMLIIIVLFSGVTRYLCPHPDIAIHWPLDEIGRLDLENLKKLFTLMNKQNLRLFCAQPDINREIAPAFQHRYLIDADEGIREYQQQKASNHNRLLTNNAAQA